MIGLWKIVDGKLVNKSNGKSWNHLVLVEGDESFTIQAKDNPKIALPGDWQLGPNNKLGWSSIKNLQSGKYLTATSLLELTHKGMILCLIQI